MNKQQTKMTISGQYGNYQVWSSNKSGAVVDTKRGMYWHFGSWQEANEHAYKFSRMTSAEVSNF